LLFTGVAFADRDHRRGGHKHGGDRGGKVVVRDHRSGPAQRVVVRDKRHHRHGPRGHGHVRVTNGRYVFPGGVVRVYKRPKVRRYYDMRVRPAIVVEHYDPVPGYVWVQGNWSWGGSEWIWTPGYWSADAVVVAPAPPPPPRPAVSGGITISGGISIR
jgi:hypothetical protein